MRLWSACIVLVFNVTLRWCRRLLRHSLRGFNIRLPLWSGWNESFRLWQWDRLWLLYRLLVLGDDVRLESVVNLASWIAIVELLDVGRRNIWHVLIGGWLGTLEVGFLANIVIHEHSWADELLRLVNRLLWNEFRISLPSLVEPICDYKVLSAAIEERWTHWAQLHWRLILSSSLMPWYLLTHVSVVSLPTEHVGKICFLHNTVHHFIYELVLIRNVNFILSFIADALHRCKTRILLFPRSNLRPWNRIRNGHLLLRDRVWHDMRRPSYVFLTLWLNYLNLCVFVMWLQQREHRLVQLSLRLFLGWCWSIQWHWRLFIG